MRSRTKKKSQIYPRASTFKSKQFYPGSRADAIDIYASILFITSRLKHPSPSHVRCCQQKNLCNSITGTHKRSYPLNIPQFTPLLPLQPTTSTVAVTGLINHVNDRPPRGPLMFHMSKFLAQHLQLPWIPSPGVVSAGFISGERTKVAAPSTRRLGQGTNTRYSLYSDAAPPKLDCPQQSLSDVICHSRVTIASIGKIIENESKDMHRKLRSIDQLRLKRQRRRRRRQPTEWINPDAQASWDQYQANLFNRARNVKQLATLLREYERTLQHLVSEVAAASNNARYYS